MADAIDWVGRFPALGSLSPDVVSALKSRSTIVDLPAGTRIYAPGRAPDSFLLVLEGTVRVQQVGESGREIVLYRVSPGESCTLTTACLMAYDDYPAEAVAETDIRAVAIPRATFDELVARSAGFRKFVFTAFSERITNLIRLVEEVAFARMDIRLAHKLIELSHGRSTIAATQQQLAAELGTAREVVSRMLAEFQRRGWVTAARGQITLANRRALEELAPQH